MRGFGPSGTNLKLTGCTSIILKVLCICFPLFQNQSIHISSIKNIKLKIKRLPSNLLLLLCTFLKELTSGKVIFFASDSILRMKGMGYGIILIALNLSFDVLSQVFGERASQNNAKYSSLE